MCEWSDKCHEAFERSKTAVLEKSLLVFFIPSSYLQLLATFRLHGSNLESRHYWGRHFDFVNDTQRRGKLQPIKKCGPSHDFSVKNATDICFGINVC